VNQFSSTDASVPGTAHNEFYSVEHRTNISILEEIGLERELMVKVARSTSDTLPGEVQEIWH